MDGDGSTITHDNQLPDNLRDLILNNPQITWMMATGRSMDLLRATPIHQYLSTDVFHIIDGGSCLMYKDYSIHQHHHLQEHEIDLLFTRLQLDLSNYLYYSTDGIRSFAFSQDVTLQQMISKISNSVMITSDIEQFRAWLKSHPTGKILLNVKEPFDLSGLHYNSNENNFDFTTHGIHKGSAYLEMLSMYGLQANETVFVFNDKNDLPIVNHPQLSGVIKVKVGDYLPDVAADYCASTPYGVAAILETIIKG